MTQNISGKSDEKYFKLTRENMSDRIQFKKKIEKFLGLEYIREEKAGQISLIVINRSRIRDIAEFMKKADYTLKNIFLTDGISYFEITYVYSCWQYLTKSAIAFQAKINKNIEAPTLSDIFPIASFLEKDLVRRTGIIFQKNNKPDQDKEKKSMCKPFQIYPSAEVEENFQIGIFNPIHENNNYIEINSKRSTINAVELRDGWLYDKIQPKLEKKDPINGFYTTIEKVSEYSNIALSLAYFQNLESLLGKRIPNKVKYIRTLLAEMERLLHHLVWLINLSDLLRSRKKGKLIHQEFIKFQDLVMRIFNNPYLYNSIRFGTSIDIEMKAARSLWKYLKENGEKIFQKAYDFVYHKFTQNTLKDIGHISKSDGIKYNLGGPSLRGSGIPIDMRSKEPYLSYKTGEISQLWNIVSFTNGDCFSRAQVRLWEMRESIEIIKNIAKSLSIYERKAPKEKVPENIQLEANRQVFNFVEGPNGIITNYLRTDIENKNNTFYTVRFTSSDLSKFNLLRKVLLNENEEYAPLILHSLDINFNMVDL